MMSLWKAFFQVQIRRITRTAGLPGFGHFSAARLVSTTIFVIIWAALTYFAVHKLSDVLKLVALNLLFQEWVSLLFGMVSLGVLVGGNWLKYGELQEVKFLTGLPLPRVFIARWKVLLLAVELVFLLVLLLPSLIPWGLTLQWGMYSYQMIIVLSTVLIGVFTGILLSAQVTQMLFRYQKGRRIGLYFVAILLLVLPVLDLPLSVALPTNIPGGLVTTGVSLIVLVALVYFTPWAIPVYFETAGIGNDNLYRKATGRWGSFVMAVARKDMIHYYRELNQLLQMLFMIAVIAIVFTQANEMGETGTRLVLIGIPYCFAGIITMHLTGNDGVVLTLVKINQGTLRAYYWMRFLLSCVFVLVSSLSAYVVMSLIFFQAGLSLAYISGLFVLAFIFAALSLGISVMFRQESINPMIPGRGTSVKGEMLYWLLGIGLPLQLTMWIPDMGAISDIPLAFNLLALVTIIAALVAWVSGYYLIDIRK